MDKTIMKIGIVILHYKNLDFTADCLHSVEKLDRRNMEITVFVVDNASGNNLFKLPKLSLPVRVLSNAANLGYAGGNNTGVKAALAAGAEYIWILNNDTVVERNCLRELIKIARQKKQGGVFGPKIYFAPGYEYHKERYNKADRGRVIWWAGGEMDWGNVMGKHRGVDEVDRGQYNILQETETITGAAMFVLSTVFKKIGFFDEKYFLYFEESDFCQRVKQAGYGLWYVPNALVWHKNAGSSGAGSALHDYYLTRNRLLFGLHNAPLRSKIALIREAVRLLLAGREWQKKGVRDFLLCRFGRGSYIT